MLVRIVGHLEGLDEWLVSKLGSVVVGWLEVFQR